MSEYRLVTFRTVWSEWGGYYVAHFSRDVSSGGYVLADVAPYGTGASRMLAIADLCQRMEKGEFEWKSEQYNIRPDDRA
jgi:hypothetical protein